MSIDPLREQLISFGEAAKLFPKNSRGKHPHVATLYRYASRGVCGVVLESVKCGGARAVSREEVARFIALLSEARSIQRPAEPTAGYSVNKQPNGSRKSSPSKRAEAVEAALDEIGIRMANPRESKTGGAQ